MNHRGENDRNEQAERPLLAVLTGGVAAGKTAASDAFAALGITVIDTDKLSREVVEPGQPGLREVTEAFGTEVLADDGTLNRRRLRDIVFADESNRQRLESILHPLIESRARERIREAVGEPYVVLVVPLLIESGLFEDADCVIVVDAPESTRIERLIARDDINERQARDMLNAQAPRKARLAVADEVLDNNTTPEALQQAVERLHQRLLNKAAARPEDRSTAG